MSKETKNTLMIAVLALLFLLGGSVPENVASATSQNSALVAQLAGLSMVLTALVNAMKKFGIVKDGDALLWNKYLTMLAVVLVTVVRHLYPQFDVKAFDALAVQTWQGLAGMVAIALAFAHYVAPSFHDALKKIPLIGYSHSEQ